MEYVPAFRFSNSPLACAEPPSIVYVNGANPPSAFTSMLPSGASKQDGLICEITSMSTLPVGMQDMVTLPSIFAPPPLLPESVVNVIELYRVVI